MNGLVDIAEGYEGEERWELLGGVYSEVQK